MAGAKPAVLVIRVIIGIITGDRKVIFAVLSVGRYSVFPFFRVEKLVLLKIYPCHPISMDRGQNLQSLKLSSFPLGTLR